MTALMTGEAYRQSADHRPRPRRRVRPTTPRNESSFLRVIAKHRDASYQIPRERRARRRCSSRRARRLGRGPGAGHRLRLPQRAGHRAGPHRHHRVHDGLRHHGHRAGHRAHQVQEARRRGLPQDRQPDRAGRPAQAGLHARPRSRRSSPTSTSARRSRARPGCKPEHLPVFDCAFKPVNGERSIHYMGHIRMMGAVQPFLSGAISKTVNMPEAATAEEIEDGLPRGLEAGPQGHRDLPRRLQAVPAAAAPARRRTRLRRGKAAIGPAPAARGRPGRGQARTAAACRTSAGRHPQVPGRRPRGLHHRRPLPGRPARRDLPQDGQGRLHGQRPDGHAGHDDLAWRSSTACRCGTWSTSSPTSASSPPASPATRRSRSPSRSWTTSSAGWARGSCRARRRAPWG